MYEHIFKHNPYHDAQGRFSTGDGATYVNIWGKPKDRPAPLPKPTAPPRETHLTRKEFGTRMSALHHVPELTTAHVDDLYQASKGRLDPVAAVKAFTGRDDVGNVSVTLTSMPGNKVKVKFRGTSYGSELAYAGVRTFDFDKNDVHHDLLMLKPGDQNQGTVKKLFTASIPLYKSMGMKSISVMANVDRGGYAWAKYGFTPVDPAEFYQAAEKGAGQIAKSIDQLHVSLSPAARGELYGAQELIYDHRHDPYISHLISDIKTPHLDQEAGEVFKAIDRKGTNNTFAKTMLYNTSWDGEINFNDKKSMDRLEAYLKH